MLGDVNINIGLLLMHLTFMLLIVFLLIFINTSTIHTWCIMLLLIPPFILLIVTSHIVPKQISTNLIMIISGSIVVVLVNLIDSWVLWFVLYELKFIFDSVKLEKHCLDLNVIVFSKVEDFRFQFFNFTIFLLLTFNEYDTMIETFF